MLLLQEYKCTILCFVDRPSLYNLVNKAKLVHNFSRYVSFFSLHVSGNYVPIIRRNNCIYATLGNFLVCRRWGASVTPRPLSNPGKDPVPIVQEAGWKPMAGLDRCGKSRPHRDSIPGPSSPQPVAMPTELPGPQFYGLNLYKSVKGVCFCRWYTLGSRLMFLQCGRTCVFVTVEISTIFGKALSWMCTASCNIYHSTLPTVSYVTVEVVSIWARIMDGKWEAKHCVGIKVYLQSPSS
jgi:hypothetical protein